MIRLDINKTKVRLNSFYKEKTFTYIREIQPNGRPYYYNGFIINVKSDSILFFDIFKKIEFPIQIICIVDIQPSTRMTKDIAIKTLNEYYNKNKGEKDDENTTS